MECWWWNKLPACSIKFHTPASRKFLYHLGTMSGGETLSEESCLTSWKKLSVLYHSASGHSNCWSFCHTYQSIAYGCCSRVQFVVSKHFCLSKSDLLLLDWVYLSVYTDNQTVPWNARVPWQKSHQWRTNDIFDEQVSVLRLWKTSTHELCQSVASWIWFQEVKQNMTSRGWNTHCYKTNETVIVGLLF